jgi:hypothetical protein
LEPILIEVKDTIKVTGDIISPANDEEWEALRTTSEESERRGTNKLKSRQIGAKVKATHKRRTKRQTLTPC